MTSKSKTNQSFGDLCIQYLDHGARGRSVSIGYRQADELHVCRLDVTPKKITPLRGIFSGNEIPPLAEEHPWQTGNRFDEWIFSLLGGEDPKTVCGILCVPESKTGEIVRIASIELPKIAKFLQEFVDSRAIAALSRSRNRNLDQLGFYSGDSERAVRRRQAAESYPITASLLATDIRTKIAIDRAMPLAPVLQKAIGNQSGTEITKGVVKRLAKATKLPQHCNLDAVARFASNIPTDWIPTEGDQWKSFCHAAECIVSILNAPDRAIRHLVGGRSGDWTRMHRKVIVEGGLDPEDGFDASRYVMHMTRQMAISFADMCILPLAACRTTREGLMVTPELRTWAINAAFEILFDNRGIVDVAEASRRWNYTRAEIDETIRQFTDANLIQKIGHIEENSWPPVTDAIATPSGLEIVPLTSNEELNFEGMNGKDPNGCEGLHHCIANYKEKARRADCHIVSIRKCLPDGTVKRLSTVEFASVTPNHHTLRVTMHRGKRNSQPGAESRDALSWYMQSVAMKRLKINFDQIFAFQENRLNGDRPVDGLERLCGFDWKEEKTVEAVVKAWNPFVISQWKGKSMDELIGCRAVSDVADKILPDIHKVTSIDEQRSGAELDLANCQTENSVNSNIQLNA